MQDILSLSPIVLKGKETFTEKMKRKIDFTPGLALYSKTRVDIQWNLFCSVFNVKKVAGYGADFT